MELLILSLFYILVKLIDMIVMYKQVGQVQLDGHSMIKQKMKTIITILILITQDL